MTSCGCANPPGGRIFCDDDQMPKCKIVGGQVHGSCVSFSEDDDATTGFGVARWAVRVVTERTVDPTFVSEHELRMLQSGRYEEPFGTLVTFRIPVRYYATLREWRPDIFVGRDQEASGEATA